MKDVAFSEYLIKSLRQKGFYLFGMVFTRSNVIHGQFFRC